MFCYQCGKDILGNGKFCPECGSDISKVSTVSEVEGDVSVGNMKTMVTGSSTESDLSMGDMRAMGRVENAGSSNKTGFVSVALSERYELGEVIGRGGFASVFRATDKKLGRTVAIKKLHPEQADSVTMARFLREGISIAGLNHRNIVQVYDVGEDPSDGSLYLVMELIEGGSLYDLLKKRGKLELPEAMELFKGIAQGLSHAHRKNLVHRDIKPANILLHSEGETIVPKIVDFGLAQAGRESELSMSGYGMGTVVYMPPEQRRDAKSVNHTADVYALGKVLYEMVSGESPDTLDPSEIPPPKELADIIFKCTKPKPEDRFFSVDEVLQALEKNKICIRADKKKIEEKRVVEKISHEPSIGDEKKSWYYTKNEQRIGPLEDVEMESLIKRGEILFSTRVWRQGTRAWLEASESEFAIYFPKKPPVVPVSLPQHSVATFSSDPVYYQRPEGLRVLLLWRNILCGLSVPLFFLSGIGLFLIIPAVVIECILLYRFWYVIQSGNPRTTPGKAVGFSFIPIFAQFHWWHVAWVGLSKDTNSFCRTKKINAHVNEKLARVYYSFLFFSNVPVVGIVGLIGSFIVGSILMKQLVESSIKIIHSR